MGAAKRQLEKIDNYRRMAFDVMLEIGAIKTCEIHEEFYYRPVPWTIIQYM